MINLNAKEALSDLFDRLMEIPENKQIYDDMVRDVAGIKKREVAREYITQSKQAYPFIMSIKKDIDEGSTPHDAFLKPYLMAVITFKALEKYNEELS